MFWRTGCRRSGIRRSHPASQRGGGTGRVRLHSGMANLEKLTIKSSEALNAARDLARTRGNPITNDAHLLSALLDQDEGIALPLLGKVGVNVTKLKTDVKREIDRFPKQSGGIDPQFSREVMEALDKAEAEAGKLGDEYI